MKKITKDNFNQEKIEFNLKTVIGTCIVCVLIVFEMWLKIDDKILFFVITFIFIFIILVVCILEMILKRKTQHLPSPYYIVEDVFIHVFEKEYISLKHANRLLYTLKFSKSGEYTYWASKRWKNQEKDDENYSAIFFSNPGDKFYLVIAKRDGKICRCYNKKYFSLYEDDFDYIDGKYYPKKINTFNDLGN